MLRKEASLHVLYLGLAERRGWWEHDAMTFGVKLVSNRAQGAGQKPAPARRHSLASKHSLQ